jgi:hypothetical protein
MLDFDTIKKYYDKKFWSKKMVANAVVKGIITPEEYQMITGDQYI